MWGIRKLLLSICLFAGITTSWAQNDTLFLDRETAVEIALENNPGMEIADLERARTQAGLQEARGNLFPRINASGSYTRNLKKQVIFFPEEMAGMFGGTTALEVGSDNSFMGGIQLALPVYNGAIYSGIRAADKQHQIAEQGYQTQTLELSWNVRQAWYDALLAAESLGVIELSFENAMENLENIRRMHQQGLVAEYDLISAEVQTENLRPELLRANNMYELSINYLKILLGLDENQAVVLRGSLLESSEQMLEDFSVQTDDLLLNSNPAYINLGLQQELLIEQSKAVKASGLPSLNAVGNFMYLTESNDFDFGEYNWVNTASAGLQLNIPIFQGRTIHNQVKQIEIGAKQLQLQREYLKENLSIELSNAIKSMNVAIEKSQHAMKNVELAKRGYDIARIRYESGQGTLLEINDSDVALTRARFNLLQARYELLIEKINYDRVVGQN